MSLGLQRVSISERVDPLVVGIFQIFLDFPALHIQHKNLILIRIYGEEVIVEHVPGIHRGIEAQRCCERQVGISAVEAYPVYQIHIVAHTHEGIPGLQRHGQLSHLLHGEGLYCLIIRPEHIPHHRVCLLLVYIANLA